MTGLCTLCIFFDKQYSNTYSRQFMRTAILYNKIHDNTSGPFPHVLADIQKHIRYRPEERIKADDIRIIQRPIISMEKYLTNASPTHRWNVIILVVESLRADQLRAYGGS